MADAMDKPKQGKARKRLVSACARTRMCKYYLEGICKQGDNCSFAHSSDELRDQPNMQQTRLCKYWMVTGTCASGASCSYAHGANNLRPSTHIQQEADEADALNLTSQRYFGYNANVASSSGYDEQPQAGEVPDAGLVDGIEQQTTDMPCIEAGGWFFDSVMQPEDQSASSASVMYHTTAEGGKEHRAVFGDAVLDSGCGNMLTDSTSTQDWPAGDTSHVGLYGYEAYAGHHVSPDSGLLGQNMYSAGAGGECLQPEACTPGAPEAWTETPPAEDGDSEAIRPGQLLSF
eukprot:TRINITY_DN47735_c0_g1_i1.p1 TRINITY_DN47735_c0_g1~~TRINITY_DN47735_c0_g1_i1.p1  ORF type:complete len:289 (+),score=39.27 TRINITY_DN47735_c0_g1_i1:181-1047(+)